MHLSKYHNFQEADYGFFFYSSTCHANCGFYQKFHDDLEEWNAIIRNAKKQLYSTRYVNYVRKIAGEV